MDLCITLYKAVYILQCIGGARPVPRAPCTFMLLPELRTIVIVSSVHPNSVELNPIKYSKLMIRKRSWWRVILSSLFFIFFYLFVLFLRRVTINELFFGSSILFGRNSLWLSFIFIIWCCFIIKNFFWLEVLVELALFTFIKLFLMTWLLELNVWVMLFNFCWMRSEF